MAVMTASMTERMQDEVRSLATERKAVVLAHNYQVPEVQDVADYVGDSLGLSQQAAATEADVIVFCGVHFMAETAAVLAPEKTVLIPDLDAGCSLAASIDAERCARWKDENPGAVVVSYVNTTAEVKALRTTAAPRGTPASHRRRPCRPRHPVPARHVPRRLPRARYRSEDEGLAGECHVHAGIRPADIAAALDDHPDAELLDPPGVRLRQPVHVRRSREPALGADARTSSRPRAWCSARGRPEARVHGRHRDRHPAPARQGGADARFYAMSERAVCRYMKMITLEKLRDSLLEMRHRVTVDPELAARARGAIQRMVEIT